jgi:uncharacterized protein (TIGR02246 family)
MEQNEAAIRDVVKRVEAGWNAGDGEAFAAPFAEDADYVIVNGRHERGRATIAEGHKYIFSTIYKGSNNTFTVEDVRLLRPDVAVAHVHHVLKFYAGETAQEAQARSTWVLTKTDGEWRIDAFQNTPIQPQVAGSN